jgi:hypothetical protein
VFAEASHTYVRAGSSRFRCRVRVNQRNLLLRDDFVSHPRLIFYSSKQQAAVECAGEVTMIGRGSWINCGAAADAGYTSMTINTAVHRREHNNCVFKWNYRLGQISVYATKNIRAGDELFVRYDANGANVRRIRSKCQRVPCRMRRVDMNNVSRVRVDGQ